MKSNLALPNGFWRVTIDTNPEDCNLNCIMCEEHSQYSNFIVELYEKTGVRKRRMPSKWVKRIFKESKELGVREIIPSTMGEPLLYKDIEDIIELCSKYDIRLNLTTNGTFPRKSASEWAKLIIPITSDIKISWNGAKSQTAESIMQGINFKECLENIKQLVDFRDKHYESTGYYCRITFQLTFMKNNMYELADIVRLAAKLGVDRVKGHHLWTHFNEIKSLSFRGNDASVALWNQYVSETIKATEMNRKPNGEPVLLENIIPLKSSESHKVPDDYECPFLGKELWVSATGSISPCCAPDNLRKKLGDFGNIQTTFLRSVLESENYQNLLATYKEIPLCGTCNMRRPAIQ